MNIARPLKGFFEGLWENSQDFLGSIKVLSETKDKLILTLIVILLGASGVFLPVSRFISPLIFPSAQENRLAPKQTLRAPYLATIKEDQFEINLPAFQMLQGYSFEYTSLGFGLRSLDFIQAGTKEDAEKMLVELMPDKVQARAVEYVRAVLTLCERYQVDPIWILSIMWTESHFRFRSLSHKGARGLMQIMPGTRKFIYRTIKRNNHFLVVEEEDFNLENYFPFEIPKGKKDEYVSKLVNIELGIIYLKKLLKRFNFNHRVATVAYNMGPGWAQYRLANNLPVGVRNQYLNKVKSAYDYIVQRI